MIMLISSHLAEYNNNFLTFRNGAKILLFRAKIEKIGLFFALERENEAHSEKLSGFWA